MTGRYPFRTGIVWPEYPLGESLDRQITNDTAASQSTPGTGYLDTSEIGIAETLESTYNTGFGGKWNLRYGVPNGYADSRSRSVYWTAVDNQKDHLNSFGFQETFGYEAATSDTLPYALIGNTVDYFPPQLQEDADPFFPDKLNAWAVSFIHDKASDTKPFYLHYCLGLIHDSGHVAFPIRAKTDKHFDRHKNFAEKVVHTDKMIGNVLKALKDAGVEENTLVIIAGDNGTEQPYPLQ